MVKSLLVRSEVAKAVLSSGQAVEKMWILKSEWGIDSSVLSTWIWCHENVVFTFVLLTSFWFLLLAGEWMSHNCSCALSDCLSHKWHSSSVKGLDYLLHQGSHCQLILSSGLSVVYTVIVSGSWKELGTFTFLCDFLRVNVIECCGWLVTQSSMCVCVGGF